MKRLGFILPLVLAALLMGSCRSQSALKKQKVQQEREDVRLVHALLEEPPVQELTSSLSLNVSGTKVNGQLRMRRGRSIQISASMLGLVEVGRIEFLPDMVVVVDRIHNVYSVCHYADVPYRNDLGLDFQVVQSFFWNRIFSPGSADLTDASSRLHVERSDNPGTVAIRDMECGYLFESDGKETLNAVSKSAGDFSFRIDYSDFTAVSDKWQYPLGWAAAIKTSGSTINVSAKMSSVSTDNKNWPDRTQVPRRMKQVTLDELLDTLDL